MFRSIILQALFISTMVFGCTSQKSEPIIENRIATPTDFEALWNYDNPAETENKFLALLPEYRNFGDIARTAELLTQIARAQGLSRKFEQAHKTLDEAKLMIEEAMTKAKVRLLLERGRVFNSSGDRKKSRPLFLEAYELALENGHEVFAIDAAHMLGIIEQPDQALIWNEKALKMALASDNEKAKNWEGSLANNIGWTYFEQKRYDEALVMFERALVFRKRQGKPKRILIARWSIAKTYRMLGKTEKALAIQLELLEQMRSLGEKDGFINEELAECYLSLGKAKEAKLHFSEAYRLLSEDAWFVESYPERLKRLKQLGGQ